MQIIMPIVGRQEKNSDDFFDKNFKTVGEKYILEHVFKFIEKIEASKVVVILKKADVEKYYIDSFIKMINRNVKIIVAEEQTKGAACSCLLAIDELNMEEELLIVAPDKLYDEPLNLSIDSFRDKKFDAGVIVFDDINPKYSYVKLDVENYVIEVAEKKPISRNAVAGIYYYKKADYFIESAQQMILKKSNVNNQFFVAPSINELILTNKKVGIYKISRDSYFDLNDDDSLKRYKKNMEDKNV